MKVEPFNYSTENSGVISTSQMGIDKSGEVFIYEVLRKQLYSQPVLGVVREYSCNSRDEHVLRGIPERPIEVTLPSFEKPEFIVRDFGFGLSDEKLKNTFGMYGASTKRDSNELIGQLGIGSKVAFAIGDNFSVVSRHEGIKNIYSLVINSDGRGEVLLLNSSPTDEESGLEVIVPVQVKDIDTFINTALDFFGYWEIKPILHNCFKAYPERKYITKTDKYAKLEDKTNSVVVMGNIAYKLQTDQLPDLNSGQKAAFQYGWHFYVQIGDVDFSANRETLRYSNKTVSTLTAIILETIEDYRKQLQVNFDKCANLKEAKILWKKVKENDLFYRYCNSKVEYKGQEISNEYFNVIQDDAFTVNIKSSSYRLKNSLSPDLKISALQNNIYYSVGKVSRFWHRVRTLERGTVVIVKEIGQPGVFEDFVKKNGLEDFNFINLETIVLPKREAGTRDYSGRISDPKHSKQVFALNPLVAFENNKHSWDIANININNGGIYVILDRFEIAGAESVRKFIKLNLGVKLYGIKTSLVGELNKKWVHLGNYLQEQIEKLAKRTALKELQKARDIIYYQENLFDLGNFKKEGLAIQDLQNGSVKRTLALMGKLLENKNLERTKILLEGSSVKEPSETARNNVANCRISGILANVVINNWRIDQEDRKKCLLKVLV